MIIIQREPTRYFQFDSDRFQFDKFKDAIEYLHLFVRTSPSRLWNFEEDNGNGYDALKFIGKIVAYLNEDIDYDIFTQNEFDEIFSILLDFFYMHRNEINFNLCVNVLEAQNTQSLDAIQKHSLSNLIFILNNVINNSNKMQVNFVKQYKGLETCLMFLNDQEFWSKNMNAKLYTHGKPTDFVDFLIMIIGNKIYINLRLERIEKRSISPQMLPLLFYHIFGSS